MAEQPRDGTVHEKQAEDYIAETETGARQPTGLAAKVLLYVALAWSLFQLWYASPLPFILDFGIFNSTEARAIHLGFAMFLAYTAYPALTSSPRGYIPIQDWVLALVASASALYLFVFYQDIAQRAGITTTRDVVVGVTGMLLLLEATRRALGPPLMIVAAVFLGYTFFGPYMPDVIAFKGVSLERAISHYWITTEGVFGVALGVSTSMVFLFVLFGALLERAGAGNYFIRVAFSLLGHMRGGPAKASVVASGMTGLISGSSIANVVTTGTFTIPLMKKVGLPPEKAGAVEVAASTNGQLTPPVMGAAAFLIAEYVGISYVEVMKHAILPALISYIALVYIVHLEASKLGLKGMEREVPWPLKSALVGMLSTFSGLIILSAAVYYGLGWTKDIFGDATSWIAAIVLIGVYVALLRYSLAFPELANMEELSKLPPPGPTVKSGLYFLLPVVVLVWSLTIERLSPGLSAFWAVTFMLFIVATQRPLKVMLGQAGDVREKLTEGLVDLREGLVMGGRNMIGIGVATAAAGVVVGTVTLTGIGLVMTEFVEFISAGNLFLMLLFTAVISLLLGMGLPTTANYIVVSSLMAPVIVTLGAEQGLLVPLIAVHLFVFYFGILADDTPPVGLAAFAAAAIAKSDPIKTGIQGFTYDIRTAILPFLFIFNTELLLIGVTSWWHAFLVFVVALIAMLTFAAATQRFMLTHNRLWETLALLLVAFTLFRPGFWWDMIYPPYQDITPSAVEQVVEAAETVPPGQPLRLVAEGYTLKGEFVTKHVALNLPAGEGGLARLDAAGLTLREDDGAVVIDMIGFGSQAQKSGLDFDWAITEVLSEADRPPRELMYIPAFVLLGFILFIQASRRRRDEARAAAT